MPYLSNIYRIQVLATGKRFVPEMKIQMA